MATISADMAAARRGPGGRPSAADTAAKLTEPPTYEPHSAAATFHPSGPRRWPTACHAATVPMTVPSVAARNATTVSLAVDASLQAAVRMSMSGAYGNLLCTADVQEEHGVWDLLFQVRLQQI